MATRALAVLMEDQRIKDVAAKTARLKALREQATAAGWTPPAAKANVQDHEVQIVRFTDKDATRRFLDLIDTSAGPEDCHPWQGTTRWNHPDDSRWERYRQPVFRHPDVKTRQASRILVVVTYGYEPPAHLDMTPTCRDHLCMNLTHYRLTPQGSSSVEAKLKHGIDPAAFQCEAVHAA